MAACLFFLLCFLKLFYLPSARKGCSTHAARGEPRRATLPHPMAEIQHDPEALLSCTDIARLIAEKHNTTCAHTTVWHAVKRLKLEPKKKTGSGYKFYSTEQVPLIEAALTGILARK